MARSHVKREAHYRAERIIHHAIANDGQVPENNRELAALLGMTTVQVGYARVHTHQPGCDLGYVINYRSGRGPGRASGMLTISDPDELTATLDAPEDRASRMLAGHHARRQQHATEQAYMAHQWEYIGADALSRGNKPLHRACLRAAADVESSGWLAGSTIRRLAKLGVA